MRTVPLVGYIYIGVDDSVAVSKIKSRDSTIQKPQILLIGISADDKYKKKKTQKTSNSTLTLISSSL